MWRNWAGGQRCAPVRTERPRDAGEVADAVVRAGRDGHAVRTAGGGHSFSDLVVTPACWSASTALGAVLEVDAGAGLVRAQAGITLGRLGEALAGHGLALRNLGDIDRQSLAGAIATATHGTGTGFPTLSEDVAAIELVTADGTLRRWSPEDDAELFRAAQVSLGALGVVTAITVRCVPGFRLRVVEEARPLADVLDALDDLAGAHDHFEVFSFPYADWALVRTAERTDEPPTPRGPLRVWAQDVLVGNHLFEAALIAGAGVPAAIPPLNRLATRAGGGSSAWPTAGGPWPTSGACASRRPSGRCRGSAPPRRCARCTGRFANAGLDRVLGLPAASRRRAYASASRAAAAIDGR